MNFKTISPYIDQVICLGSGGLGGKMSEVTMGKMKTERLIVRG